MKRYPDIKSLKAFTLVELLVVIAISCLLVAMVYTGVRFFTGIYWKHKIQHENVNSVYSFQSGLWHEITSASLVGFNEGERSLHLFFLPADTISYSFFNKGIVRQQKGRRDTVDLVVESIDAGFMDIPVAFGFIDKLSFILKYQKHEKELLFTKAYSPYIQLTYIIPVNGSQ